MNELSSSFEVLHFISEISENHVPVLFFYMELYVHLSPFDSTSDTNS